MAVITLTASQAIYSQMIHLTNARHALRSAERCHKRGNHHDGVRMYLRQAQACIVAARRYYAHAMGIGTLTHHYLPWDGMWRAMVHADGMTVWIGVRTYGKRQSAQRAAAKQVTRFLTQRALPASLNVL